MGNVASPRVDPIIPSARLPHVIFGIVILAALIAGPTDIRNRCRYEGGNSKSDFLIYYEASRAFFDGREPYRDVRLSGGDYYIYPPFFAIAIHPLTVFPAETAGVLWFFIDIGFLLASYGEVRRLLEVMLRESLFPPVPLLLAIAPTGRRPAHRVVPPEWTDRFVRESRWIDCCRTTTLSKCSSRRSRVLPGPKLLAIAGIVVINSYYLVRKLTPETPLLGIGMAAWVALAAVVVAASAAAAPWSSRRRDGPHYVVPVSGSSPEEAAPARGSDC